MCVECLRSEHAKQNVFIFIERTKWERRHEKRGEEKEKLIGRNLFIGGHFFYAYEKFYEMVVLAVINNKTPPLNRLVHRMKSEIIVIIKYITHALRCET